MKSFRHIIPTILIGSILVTACNAQSEINEAQVLTPTIVSPIPNTATITPRATITSTPTQTATFTITPTFTPSITPMPTATNTPTPIPRPLTDLPSHIDNADLAIANGNLVVQITRIRVLDNVDKMKATGANRLLGFYVVLYNYSSSEQTLNDYDFNFRYGDTQTIPSVDLMDIACTTLLEKSSPCAPRRNVFWNKDFNISAKDWTQTILERVMYYAH